MKIIYLGGYGSAWVMTSHQINIIASNIQSRINDRLANYNLKKAKKIIIILLVNKK